MEEVKISVETKSDVEKSISIEIPRSIYNEKFEHAIRKASQQARVKGFRPGRAPRAIIQKLYGTQIHKDVLGEIVSSAYHDAVQTHDLKVVGYPDIAIDGESDSQANFVVTAGVSVFPEPDIKDYFGLGFEVEVEPFRPEQVEEQIQRMREAYSDLKPIEDRELAEDGDTAMLDYRGTIEGAEFPGSTAEGTYVVLGSGTLPSSLETAIVGQKVGEEREIFVDFTEKEGPELAGKTALYVVKLRGLYKKELPEVDDAFAKKTQLGDTVDAMRSKLEELIRAELDRRAKSAKEEGFFKKLIEVNPFEVPQAMCDEEIRNFLYEMGLLDPSNRESQHFDVTGFRETLGEAAAFRVRQAVALNAILEKEKVEVDQAGVEAWLEERAEQEGRSRAELERAYGYPKNLPRLQRIVAREKLLADLVAKSQITEVEKKAAAE